MEEMSMKSVKPKKIAKELLRNEPKKIYRHTRRVADLCKKFRKRFRENYYERFGYGMDVDKKALKTFAYLHDTPKAVLKKPYDKSHNKEWPIRTALKGYKLPCNKKTAVKAIAAHKGKFNPPADYEIESAILRICDKLDRFNKEKADAFDKCEKSLRKILEVLDKDTGEVFEKTYREILSNYSRRAFISLSCGPWSFKATRVRPLSQ